MQNEYSVGQKVKYFGAKSVLWKNGCVYAITQIDTEGERVYVTTEFSTQGHPVHTVAFDQIFQIAKENVGPFVINTEFLIMFDVDQTLVIWGRNDLPHTVEIQDPVDRTNYYKLTKHLTHIKLLKDHKKRGYCVGVWSAQGPHWCLEVCKALDILDSVDFVMPKPIKYVDDLPPNEIFKNHIYVEPPKKLGV